MATPLTRVGFVVSAENWTTVVQGLPEGLVAIEWVSHSASDALDYLALGEISLVVSEAHSAYLTEEVIAAADQRGIVVAGLITSPAAEEVATDLGIGHRLRQPEDLEVLVARLRRGSTPEALAEGLPGTSPVTGTGVVRVFFGAHGAPGVTSLCLAQASVLARAGLRVCVIDADARGGVVAMAVGITEEIPGFLAAIRLASKGQLSRQEVDRVSQRYQVPPADFAVLTSAPRPLVRGEVPRDALDGLLEQLRVDYDVVVVDAGSCALDTPQSLDPVTAHSDLASHLLWRADDVVMVCAASPSGIARFARALPQVHTHAGTTPVQVWLNGVDTSRRALGEESVLREALWRFAQISDYSVIPHDGASARLAARQAVAIPEASPASPLVQAITTQSEHIIDQVRSGQRRQGQQSEQASDTPNTLLAQRSGQLMAYLGEKWKQLTALR